MLGVSAVSPAAFSDVSVVKAADCILSGPAGSYEYEVWMQNDYGELTFCFMNCMGMDRKFFVGYYQFNCTNNRRK